MYVNKLILLMYFLTAWWSKCILWRFWCIYWSCKFLPVYSHINLHTYSGLIRCVLGQCFNVEGYWSQARVNGSLWETVSAVYTICIWVYAYFTQYTYFNLHLILHKYSFIYMKTVYTCLYMYTTCPCFILITRSYMCVCYIQQSIYLSIQYVVHRYCSYTVYS